MAKNRSINDLNIVDDFNALAGTSPRQKNEEEIVNTSLNDTNLVNEIANSPKVQIITKENITHVVFEEQTTYYTKDDIFTPYPDEKLRLPLKQGEEREKLKQSIRICGVQEDVICMVKDNNELIVLSGHNRIQLVHELNSEGYDIKIPFKVKVNLQEKEEELIVIDTNLLGRQVTDLPPSTLAYLLKVKRDCIQEKGRDYFDTLQKQTTSATNSVFVDRTQSTSEQNNTQEKRRWSDNNEYRLGATQVNLYIRLNDLIDVYKEKIDSKQLTITIAYEIAFLNKEQQNILYEFTTKNNLKINAKFVKSLKANRDKEFTEEYLQTAWDLINKPKESNKEKVLTLNATDFVGKYIQGVTMDYAVEIIEKALELYFKK